MDAAPNPYPKKAVDDLRAVIQKSLDSHVAHAKELQAAAPTPSGRGWDKNLDAAAITAMKAAWIKGRHDYELVEGATAPVYADLDYTLDGRYDDFMAKLIVTDGGAGGDAYLFDGVGVTGWHGVERILYVNDAPARVVTFEATLPGYVVAKFPSTQQEAADFKSGLCQRLVDDTILLQKQWAANATLDIGAAFQGLVALMNEQREKVLKAASNEEESRYSQNTMADLRDNLSGTRDAYAVFRPWVEEFTQPVAEAGVNESGQQIDLTIAARFADLDDAYSAIIGPAFPPVPATWTEPPNATDAATPFGQLFTQILGAVDPNSQKSIVFSMNDAATLLGFPVFKSGH